MLRSQTKKIVALVFAALLSSGAFADTETVNGVTYTYSISNGEATIGYGSSAAISTSFEGALNIPTKLGGYPVTRIGDNAFKGLRFLTSVTIPEGVKTIGDYAFSSCSWLTSVTIPGSVTKVGNFAFYLSRSLIRVNISDLAKWCEISFVGNDSNPCYYAHGLYLNGEKITNLVIPENVTKIGKYQFYNCSSFTSVMIPEGVTTIDSFAFSGCSSLVSVNIPGSVETIANAVFWECHSLTSVMIEDGVTTIGSGAFNNCSMLKSITIPDSVKKIENGALSGTYFYDKHPDGFVVLGNGFLYKFKGDCPSEVVIPDGVTTIGDYAFYGSRSLKMIKIPRSVTAIGDYAFAACSSLSSVTIPSRVMTIGELSFYQCSALSSMTIPSSVTIWGYGALWACSSLASVYVDKGDVERVKGFVRKDISGVDKLTFIEMLPDGGPYKETVNGVEYTFFVSNGEATIGTGSNSSAVPASIPDAIVIPSRLGGRPVATIGENAFFYSTYLTSVELPEGLVTISDWAFSYCPSLADLVIPNGVTTIGAGAFSGDNDLASVTIPSSVTSVGSGAFWGCSALKSVYVENADTARVKELMRGKGVDVDKLTFIGPRPAAIDGASEEVKAAFDKWVSDNNIADPSAANVNAFVLGLAPTATEEEIQAKVEAELKSLDLGKLAAGDSSAAVAQIQAKYPNAKVELKEVEGFETSAHLYKLVIRLK